MDILKFQLKGIVVGDSGVGKTSLLNRFVRQQYSQHYQATIGADFLSKETMIDDKHIALQIWDTAGQQRFQSLGMAFYRGADFCLIVYDITSLKSFQSVQNWKSEFIKQSSPVQAQTFPFVVIGNKSDKDSQRAVSLSKASRWAQDQGIPFFEASAKQNVNVEQAFQNAAKLALQREERLNPKTRRASNVNLASARKIPQKKKCCQQK